MKTNPNQTRSSKFETTSSAATHHWPWAIGCWVLTFCLLPSVLLAQGSLTPPGAPAPTMKTLAQIEPRTPINTTTTPGDSFSLYRISQPGAYYLTTNLTGVAGKNGIGIAANNVTLDLNGFALLGVSNSSDGIAVMDVAHTNISVRNGALSGWGDYGMNMGAGSGGIYQDVQLSLNGTGGLRAGSASVIRGCVAFRNGGTGITGGTASTISGCSARFNASHGFQATSPGVLFSDCSSADNGGNGFHGTTSVSFHRCISRDNTSHGFYADTGGVFRECMAHGNGTNGILARARSYVVGNNCGNNSGAGIRVDGDASRVEDNNITGNTGAGIEVNGTVNLIIRNSTRGNVLGNFDIVSGNRVGIIVIPTASGAITFNGPGSGLGTTDPWANFAF